MHVDPDDSCSGQLLVCEKPAPVTAMAEIFRGLPVLFPNCAGNVAVWPVTTELKERLVGVSTTFTPVPFTFTVLRLPGRLLTMRTLPLTPPSCVGVNVSLTVQLAFGGNVVKQSDIAENCAEVA